MIEFVLAGAQVTQVTLNSRARARAGPPGHIYLLPAQPCPRRNGGGAQATRIPPRYRPTPAIFYFIFVPRARAPFHCMLQVVGVER